MDLFTFLLIMFIQSGLTVTSPDFKANGLIPSKFTCEGSEISPGLKVTGIPKGTVSLALIVDDTYAPGQTYDHWIVWNLPPDGIIKQNIVPGIQGKNGGGESKYKGPCPPTGTHKYSFRVYALDRTLNTETGADKKQLEEDMKDHILAQGELIGLYKKKNHAAGSK